RAIEVVALEKRGVRGAVAAGVHHEVAATEHARARERFARGRIELLTECGRACAVEVIDSRARGAGEDHEQPRRGTGESEDLADCITHCEIGARGKAECAGHEFLNWTQEQVRLTRGVKQKL